MSQREGWTRPAWLLVAARVLVVALCGVAVALTIILLGKSGSAERIMAARILYSAVALIFFSLVAAAGANLAHRRSGVPSWVGYLTLAGSSLAFAVATYTLWTNELFLFGGEKPIFYALLFGFITGCASVLLLTGSDRGGSEPRVARAVGLVGLIALGVEYFVELTFTGAEIGNKAYAAAAILFALGTISLAVLTFATEPLAAPADASD